MSFLKVTEVDKRIADTFALEGISFSQEQGENIGIAGATGSGKSTLLKIVAGLADADAGTVLFEGTKVRGPAYRLIPGQPGIAYLSQHYELRNHYRMEELLSYADNLPEGEAEKIFALCRISHLLQRKTDQLSGGEQQRIALARLLLTAPRLLILDEPFSNLDLIHKNILKKVLEDLSAQRGLSCIIASHDPPDLLSWAGKLLIMKAGKLIQQDSPETIYHQPAEAYTGGLLGKYNLVAAGSVAASGLSPIPEGKQLFLRPEHLLLTEKERGFAATVQQVSFWGSYYELVLHTADQELVARVPHPHVAKGQTVYITIQEHDYWYL
jgi:ABC-type sugar transport system ATPase subunit